MTDAWREELQTIGRDLANECFRQSPPDEVVDSWLDYADNVFADYLDSYDEEMSELQEKSGLDAKAFRREAHRTCFSAFEVVVHEHAKALGKVPASFKPS